MSLILEALRKSEAERRRGQAPDVLADMPQSQPAVRRPTAPWVWLLPLLAVIVVGLWLANRNDAARTPVSPASDRTTAVPQPSPAVELPPVPRLTPPPQSAAPPAVAPAASASATAAAQTAVPLPEPAPTRPAVPTAVQLPQQLASPPRVAPAPIASPVRPPPVEPLAAQPQAPISPPSFTTPAAGVESLSDLSVADRKALPPLKLSMHLWNAEPAQRFVILDGKRVVEGDRVGDTVVTEITADGVVLDWRGRRLKLPIR